jgi:hypothetical protein
MLLKRIKHGIFLVVTLLISTSCANSYVSLAQKHLELIKSNNLREANSQYCLLEEKLWLHNLNSFENIFSKEKPYTDSKTPIYYTEVIVKISTDQAIIEESKEESKRGVRRTHSGSFSMQVWRSDDFYRKSVEYISAYNDIPSRKKKPLPTREQFNKNDLCIDIPSGQITR